jgi:DNA-directed RNA polymerase subunit F
MIGSGLATRVYLAAGATDMRKGFDGKRLMAASTITRSPSPPDKRRRSDLAVMEFVSLISCLGTIADSIRERTGQGHVGDISKVLVDVNRLLDESIAADGFRIETELESEQPAVIDLTKIDFEALAKRFAKSKTKNVDLEQLKAAIRTQLEKLVRLNRARIDYLEKFEELIESYTQGSRNIDELFRELVALSRNFTDEQLRANIVGIAPRISGPIIRVGIRDNQQSKERRSAFRDRLGRLSSAGRYRGRTGPEQ